MVNILHRIPLIRHYARKWEFACFQKKWRKQNRHNRTVAMNRFPIKSVQVGKRHVWRTAYFKLFARNRIPANRKLCVHCSRCSLHFEWKPSDRNAFHLPYSIIVNQWTLSERQCEQRGRYNRR